MTPGCFMTSIDLKDAYHCVPIYKEHQKYLKFQWSGCLYQFTCYPNGQACCPRKYTKLLGTMMTHIYKAQVMTNASEMSKTQLHF